MPDVTRILHQLEAGDASAADELLPLVYAELRKLADQRLAQEKPGQTLQATALVHEAYVRLVDVDQSQDWDGRGHFFAAAAEAMRRILVENARSKQCIKRGGGMQRLDVDQVPLVAKEVKEDLLALDEALQRLAAVDAEAAKLVNLRYFGGFSNAQAASMMDISPRTADRIWAFARAWLFQALGGSNA
ncbi:ECF-type sigma factor [Rosistilla oblonga]|uniref:ECF sigma factor n=2 Tax=Rosistilla oblonga TaxID=2527990 RepID=A0A518IQR6_9BACT|nr:ECF-type sigma factor [Rosistilla oblonga]QDV55428.1 ECF sigma factor [Rosistilla oblonga]